MPHTKEPRVIVSAVVVKATADRIDRYATDNFHISRSAAVRELIEAALDRK